MKVLILEDDDEKFGTISAHIREFKGFSALAIERAANLGSAAKKLYEEAFDLVVVDLMMPLREDSSPSDLVDVTDDVLAILAGTKQNAAAQVIALSGFEDVVDSQRVKFADAGIALTVFDASSGTWGRQLDAALLRARDQVAFDFIIICALEKERAAYGQTSAKIGALRNIQGIDALELQIGTLNGVAIKLPRMGLVNAAAVTARAVELLKPRLVAMSGICAGFPEEAKIGSLLVGEICWEHQAGKWSGDGFKAEHYDVPLDANVRTTISQMIERDPRGQGLKKGLIEDPIIFQTMEIAPITTGSSVVASAERMAEIGRQHRKAAGLDMEMYGVYQAAKLAARQPIFFGAKTVVDVGDQKKSDAYQVYGCALSARFVVEAVKELMPAQ